MDIKKRIYSLSFLFLLLFVPSFSCVHAETTYTITDTELTKLEQNLQTLKKHNERKQELLTIQKNQLAEAKKELTIAQKQIKALKSLNEKTQKSLMNANQYLQEYEQENNKRIRGIERQRNIAVAFLLVSIGYAVAKG